MKLLPLAEEQATIRDVVRDVLGAPETRERVRQSVDRTVAAGPGLDELLAELGWFGMDVPDAFGGGGGTLMQLQQVFEGCGHATAPTRVLGTAGGAVGALLFAGTDDQRHRWLTPMAVGQLAGTIALPGFFGPGSGDVRISMAAGRRKLDGHAPFVVDATGADVLVVLAGDAEGLHHLVLVDGDAPGVQVDPQPTIDRTHSLARVTLTDTPCPDERVLAAGAAVIEAVEKVANRLAIAVAADAVGAASRVLELTIAHAKQRRQFGRAIGSFQAVKHQAADMLVRLELSRALVDEATAAVFEHRGDATQLSSMAKAQACETAVWIAGRGVQLHGGIGYTWEHDLHILQKRVLLDEALFGDQRWHQARITIGLNQSGEA